MLNFLHNYSPQPILFQIDWLKIHWYGIFIVLGVSAGLLVILKLSKKFNISSDEVYDLVFYLTIFGLLGGRIYAVFLDWPFYLNNPFEIIAVWHGGLAIHGALIAGVFTLIIYCRRKKQLFWQLADMLAPAVALGQSIGRWGNYFNQELFGRPTDLPWGIPINFTNRPMQYLSSQYFHPTFLYESSLNLLNFLILIFLFLKLKPANRQPGLIFLVYLINYSLIRILMEFVRVDSTPVVLGLRLPVLASLLILVSSLVVGILLLAIRKERVGR